LLCSPQEDRGGTTGEMGEGSEWIEASSGHCFGSCKAHHVNFSPQEDRRRSKSAVGEGEGGKKEGGVTYGSKIQPSTWVAGFYL
jgi:hypothetical protein